ncbi:unnamed protein product, partial [Brassica rapa subsp. trilocularis]
RIHPSARHKVTTPGRRIESDDVPGDVDGLLFGQIHRIISTTLYDDSPAELFASSSSSDQNIAPITSFT